jgi:hypothetical protein
MTADIAYLVVCSRCKGAGEILGPAVISIGDDGSGGFSPGGMVGCGKCGGSGAWIIGSCGCCEVDDEHERE